MIDFLNWSVQMNNRSEVLKEYYQLIQKLNTTNRTRNEKTEIHFYIYITTKGKHHLRATANFEHFLTVGELVSGSRLKIDPDFEFRYFVEFLEDEIRKSKGLEDINSAIRLIISRLFAV
jgi:hypothetical protein